MRSIKHAKIKASLAKRPRFNVYYTPTSLTWLHLVDRLFADLTGDLNRTWSFTSVKELVADIKAFLTQRIADLHPFTCNGEEAASLENTQHARTALNRAEPAP